MAGDIAEMRARLDEIIESVADAFFTVDSDWRITAMNTAAERQSGVECASVLGQVVWTAFPNLKGSPFEEALLRAMRERTATSGEHYYEPNGAWYVTNLRPLASGGLAIYVRDTSARRRAEQAAKQLTRERDDLLARLQEQFERMPIACIVSDPELHIIEWNPAAERVFGYSRDEVIGRNGYFLLSPPAAQVDLAEVLRRVRDGAVLPHSIRTQVTKSGRVISCEWHSTTLRDPEGRVTAVLTMADDITARSEAERKLRDSESLLAKSQRIARLGSWSWDLTTSTLLWSDEHYRLLGYEPDGLSSPERFLSHIHPDDRERFAIAFARANVDTTPFEMSWRAVRTDGEIRYMHSAGDVESDADGKPIRLLGTMQDVTEREHLLASERAARGEAERATRLRDDFLATLSHELRTPLTAILSWADLLRMCPTDTARVERGLEVIARNARTQAQLVGDLLDLSRIASGKLRLDIQRVSVRTIVEGAVEAVRPMADARGITLQLSLPSADLVNGDPSRLQQAVWNLLTNAVKFTSPGGRVEIVVARVDAQLEIRVADTGKGIAADFLPHVFARFRQADASTVREHGGLGIGLAVVKEVIELHGGTVSAHSEGIGRGATFVVRLPAIAATAGSELGAHSRIQPTVSLNDVDSTRFEGVRVLLVDDEPDALEVMCQLFTDRGAIVTAVRSVDEALRALDTQPCDVLLSDIGMPLRDGYELIAEVRKRGLSVPAAALTAFARSEDRTRALLSGFQAHLAKPLEVAQLLATVATLSGRSSQ
jgi:PAS domain S-box-containing protein